MKKTFITIIILLVGLLAGLPGQEKQNQPVYDPLDPAARPLPPNIYLILDVSGSMSFKTTEESGYRDAFGYDTFYQSRMYWTKRAIRTVMSWSWPSARWGLATYTTDDYTGDLSVTNKRITSNGESTTYNTVPDPQIKTQVQQSDSDRQYIYFTSSSFPFGWSVGTRLAVRNISGYRGTILEIDSVNKRLLMDLYSTTRFAVNNQVRRYSSSESYQTVSSVANYMIWVDQYTIPYVFGGCSCSSTYDQILEPVKYDPAITDQLFKSALDADLDNRADVTEWVDNRFPNPAVYNDTTGTVTVPGWSKPFLKEIAGKGYTPIGRTLNGIEKYIYGYSTANSAAQQASVFNYDTGALQNMTTVDSQDIYILPNTQSCRYQAIVLVTDGIDTCDSSGIYYPPTRAGSLKTKYDIDTFVIGYGAVADQAMLKELAKKGRNDNNATPYYADDDKSLEQAFTDIMFQMDSPEMSGDTEPALGFIPKSLLNTPNMVEDDTWLGQFVPPDSPTHETVYLGLQNYVVKSSTGYSPVFQGHLRLFQALRSSSEEGKIEFLTDFSRDDAIWDATDVLNDRLAATTPVPRYIITNGPGGALIQVNDANRAAIKTLTGLLDDDNTGTADRDEDVDHFIEWIRNQPLGAITYSTPAFVGIPDFRVYSNATFRSWAMANARATRKRVILVGSNDGMMHCFDAVNGDELWAFIPGALMQSAGAGTYPVLYTGLYGSGIPAQQGQPNVWGIRGQVNKNRRPHYYGVASSPRVEDVLVNGQWKTVCLFGLGGGGRQYYCLDITNPDNPSFMWSFSDARLGETWSVPAIGHLRDWTFFAAVGSGFHLDSEARIGQRFYLLDVATGTPFSTFDVGGNVTNPAPPDGDADHSHLVSQVGNCIFSPPTVFDSPSDKIEGAAAIYFSDYEGNVYRINLNGIKTTSELGASAQCELIFSSTRGTPIYGGVYAAELKMEGFDKPKRFLSFSEYGNPSDAAEFPVVNQHGVVYMLVEENIANYPVLSGTLKDTSKGATFQPDADPGFMWELGSGIAASAGAVTGLQRPAIFWQKDGENYRYWLGTTDYKYVPTTGEPVCDAEIRKYRAIPQGEAHALILDLESGKYMSSAGLSYVMVSRFGRASSFHKGVRGEGWIDAGHGETYGYGYSKSTGDFRKFGADADNTQYDQDPQNSLKARRSFWRQFK